MSNRWLFVKRRNAEESESFPLHDTWRLPDEQEARRRLDGLTWLVVLLPNAERVLVNLAHVHSLQVVTLADVETHRRCVA